MADESQTTYVSFTIFAFGKGTFVQKKWRKRKNKSGGKVSEPGFLRFTAPPERQRRWSKLCDKLGKWAFISDATVSTGTHRCTHQSDAVL